MDIFSENNIKCTKQRQIVIDIIKNNNGITIKEINELANDKINTSTIYRIIELFIKKDIITKKLIENEVIYEIKEKSHNHYFSCNKCHKKTIIPKKDIEIFENKIIKNNDYIVISHDIEFRGICSNCKGKDNE